MNDEMTLGRALEEFRRARPYKAHTHRTPKAIIVMRVSNGRSTYQSFVWTGRSPRDVLKRALRVLDRKTKRKAIIWSDKLDNFVKLFYNNGLSTTEIARHLRGMSRQPFTKNVVVRRYRNLMKLPRSK